MVGLVRGKNKLWLTGKEEITNLLGWRGIRRKDYMNKPKTTCGLIQLMHTIAWHYA